jgi:hypothetical protein
MAIDMIERNDEGVHATSRLGNFQFADDSKHFRNFTGGEDFFQGGGEDWANLFGSKVAKRNEAKATEEAKKFVQSLPTGNKTNPTCEEIAKSLELLSVYIETQVKEIGIAKGHIVNYPKNRLAVARTEEGRIKIIQSQMNCIAVQEKEKSEAAKAETLKTITNLSETSIQNAKNDLLGINQSLSEQSATNIGGVSLTNNKKLLLYGGIGVGAIVLILLLRRNK